MTVSQQYDIATRQLRLFQERRQQLIQIMEDELRVLKGLNLSALAHDLEVWLSRTIADDFTVMVVGEFNAGKSTTINAMMGNEILPARMTPATAIITILQYDDHGRAMLLPKPIPGQSDDPVAFEVPLARLTEYVTLDEDDEDRESPYQRLDIYWPLELLRNGVKLVDSPGLNALAAHDQISTDYVNKADAVLFVVRSDFPGSISQMNYLAMLKTMNHEDIFFICNFINQVPPNQRDAVRKRCENLFGQETQLGTEGIFFVDAKTALDERVRGNETGVAGTGMLEMEAALREFLANERGRLKIVRPAQKAIQTIRDTRREIAVREHELATSLDALRQLEARERETFNQLRQRLAEIRNLFNQNYEYIAGRVRQSALQRFRMMVNELPGWAAQHPQQHTLNAFSALRKQQRNEAIAEIEGALQSRIFQSLSEWREQELAPIVETGFERLSANLQHLVESFEQEIRNIQEQIAMLPVAPDMQALGTIKPMQGEVPLWERVLGAGIGVLMLDPGVFAAGAGGGLKVVWKQVGINIGIAVVAILTGAIWIYLPAAIIAAVVQVGRAGNKLNERAKTVVAEEMAKDLQARANEESERITNNVGEQLNSVRDAMVNELQVLLDTAQEQIKRAIAVKERGEQEEAAERGRLEIAKSELDSIESSAQALVVAYALH